jgi:hypothetical protein
MLKVSDEGEKLLLCQGKQYTTSDVYSPTSSKVEEKRLADESRSACGE